MQLLTPSAWGELESRIVQQASAICAVGILMRTTQIDRSTNRDSRFYP